MCSVQIDKSVQIEIIATCFHGLRLFPTNFRTGFYPASHEKCVFHWVSQTVVHQHLAQWDFITVLLQLCCSLLGLQPIIILVDDGKDVKYARRNENLSNQEQRHQLWYANFWTLRNSFWMKFFLKQSTSRYIGSTPKPSNSQHQDYYIFSREFL